MYWVSNGKINYNKLPKLPFSNFHLSSNTVRYGLERFFIIGCILWYFIVFVFYGILLCLHMYKWFMIYMKTKNEVTGKKMIMIFDCALC